MKLLLGTSNKERFSKMKRLINKFYPMIEILGSKIEAPEENGKNGMANALIKSSYYFNIEKIPTLAFDNEIYFDNWLHAIQPGHNIHSLNCQIGKRNNLYSYWKNEIINGLKSGNMIKNFALTTNESITTYQVSIPFSLVLPLGQQPTSKENILNLFMVPKGSKNSFSKMSEQEREIYDNEYFKKVIKAIYKSLVKSNE